MRRESRLSVTDVCYIAIMAAVTAVLAQIAIPMPMGVPMTMQTFAVTLCGILLGSRKGAVSMVIYLLIGTAGVPVFSAFTGGGCSALYGPTGGFLVSFPVMAYLIGLGVEWKKKGAFLIFLLLGTAFNYVAGVLFFVVDDGQHCLGSSDGLRASVSSHGGTEGSTCFDIRASTQKTAAAFLAVLIIVGQKENLFMELAFVTALGVGGATIIGVLIGFLFQKIPHEFNDVILGFAAGIMFAAAVIGLIIPSLEEGNIWVTLAGDPGRSRFPESCGLPDSASASSDGNGSRGTYGETESYQQSHVVRPGDCHPQSAGGNRRQE